MEWDVSTDLTISWAHYDSVNQNGGGRTITYPYTFQSFVIPLVTTVTGANDFYDSRMATITWARIDAISEVQLNTCILTNTEVNIVIFGV